MDAHMQPYCTCKICHRHFIDYPTFESHHCVTSLGDERFVQIAAAIAREEDFKARMRAQLQRWRSIL